MDRATSAALEGADPASTLIVVVSKTFTTQETMANAARRQGMGRAHVYAVSATQAAKAFGASEVLPMWDWVGGRFSVWSAVGFAACAMGFDRFQEFLTGGNEIDRHFAEAPSRRTCPR